MAITLNEIAIEKLLYDFNPEEAIRTFTASFGCSEEQAIEFIKGDKYVLEVDVKEQTINMIPRSEVGPDHPYPILKCDDKIWHWMDDLLDQQDSLLKCVQRTFISSTKMHNIELRSDIGIDIDNAIDMFINDRYDVVKNDLMSKFEEWIDEFYNNNTDLYNATKLLATCKAWLNECAQKMKVINWLITNNIIEEFKIPSHEDYPDRDEWWKALRKYHDIPQLITAYANLESTMNDAIERCHLTNMEVPSELDKYFEGLDAIKAKYSKKLTPDSVYNKFDAGWVSPEGDYYALNGEISHMLHLQIADALVENKLIPEYNKMEYPTVDCWLEAHGWMKVHNDWIMFDPMANYRRDKRVLQHLTDAQIEFLVLYGNLHYKGMLKFGIQHNPVSTAKLKNMDRLMVTELF